MMAVSSGREVTLAKALVATTARAPSPPSEWHRVIALYNEAASPPVVTKCVEGVERDDWTDNQGLDGPRYVLRPTAILFGDGTQDERRVMWLSLDSNPLRQVIRRQNGGIRRAFREWSSNPTPDDSSRAEPDDRAQRRVSRRQLAGRCFRLFPGQFASGERPKWDCRPWRYRKFRNYSGEHRDFVPVIEK
jgi:hypothetical protein